MKVFSSGGAAFCVDGRKRRFDGNALTSLLNLKICESKVMKTDVFLPIFVVLCGQSKTFNKDSVNTNLSKHSRLNENGGLRKGLIHLLYFEEPCLDLMVWFGFSKLASI